MRLMMSGLALAAALGAATASNAQQCPIGTYRTFDNWGNSICRRFSDQSTATVAPPQNASCPVGSYPFVDNYGNRICRTFESTNQPRTDYYDTSRGCPMGFYPYVDGYGNHVCKKY